MRKGYDGAGRGDELDETLEAEEEVEGGALPEEVGEGGFDGLHRRAHVALSHELLQSSKDPPS